MVLGPKPGENQLPGCGKLNTKRDLSTLCDGENGAYIFAKTKVRNEFKAFVGTTKSEFGERSDKRLPCIVICTC